MALSDSAALLFKINADGDQAVAEFNRVRGAEKQMEKATTDLNSHFRNLGGSLTSLGQSMTLAITAPIVALGALGVKFNATKEQALVSFGVMLKSAEAAKKLYAELQTFAAVTPFQLPEVVGAAKLLKAYGFGLEELKPLLTDVGNLASGMGASFEEVARVMGRLRSGDFGEAFERLRDFGISREQLEGQGLVFDKSGQFQGSVEQALQGVRALIQANFTGMMEAQAVTLSGRMSTLFDTINIALGESTTQLFDLLSKGLAALIPYIEAAGKWFGELGPYMQAAILAFAALAAAAGPVLIVVGSIVGAISSLVAAAAPLGVALLVVVGLFVQLGPLLAIVAAQWYLLYQAWEKNAGGIQDVTLELFEKIKAAVQNGLAAIQAFWTEHGDKIMSFVRTVWNTISNIVESAVSAIAGILRVVLAIINRDWAGAWDAFVDYVSAAVKTFTQIVLLIPSYAESALRAVLRAAISYGPQIATALVAGFIEANKRIAITIALLPAIIVSAIPAAIKAGYNLGAAVWNAIRSGFAQSMASAPLPAAMGAGGFAAGGMDAGINIPTPTPGPKGGGAKGGGGGGGGGQSAADKAKEAAEKARQEAEKELQADIAIHQGALEQVETQYRESLDRIREEFANTGDLRAFFGASQDAMDGFRESSKLLLDSLDALEIKQAGTIGPKATQLLQNQQQARRDSIQKAEEKELKETDKFLDSKLDKDIKYWKDAAAALDKGAKELADAQDKVNQDDLKRQADKLQALLDAAEKAARIRQARLAAIGAESPDADAGIFQNVSEIAPSLIPPGEEFTFQSNLIVGALGAIDAAASAVGQAVGEMVHAWVLYGTIGGSIRKVTAQILASLAQQAAAKAVFELAEGLAMLALTYFGYAPAGPSAAAHFAAAAAYGAIAGIAAIAGRIVAGNSFNETAAGATGSAAGAMQMQQGASRNAQSGAYGGTGQDAVTIEAGRNMPWNQPQEIVIKDRTGMLGQMLEWEISKNSRVRSLIVETASA